jgi:hypothetical protein
VAQDGGQLGLGRQVETFVQGADPLGAQPHLAGGLLAGDHEGGAVGGGDAVGHLEQQRGLAHARLAGHQQHGARDQASAEHAVELGDAGGDGARACQLHFRDRPRRSRDRAGGHGAQGGRGGADLLEAAPRLALGAATDPLGRGVAALRAAVRGAGGLHSRGNHTADANRTL